MQDTTDEMEGKILIDINTKLPQLIAYNETIIVCFTSFMKTMQMCQYLVKYVLTCIHFQNRNLNELHVFDVSFLPIGQKPVEKAIQTNI